MRTIIAPLHGLRLGLGCRMIKLMLVALLPLAAFGRLQGEEDSVEKAAEGNLRFKGYPENAATTKEILNTGIMLQNKDGSLSPYVPKSTRLKEGEHDLFFVWEMNPFGGSPVWLDVHGYTRTKAGWERFLSSRFAGVFGLAASIDGKRRALILTENANPNPGAKQEMFYARRLDTIRDVRN